MNKYEQLIEYIINDESDKARALFHSIVVDKSRKIYEGLMDENVGGNQAGGLVDEIQDHEETIEGDEVGVQEDEFGAEDEFGGEAGGIEGGDDFGGDEFGGEEGGIEGDEFGGDELGGEEGGIEDRVMDLESALDELKAEFDELMAGEEAEEENFPGIHDGEEGDEFGGDEEGFGDEGSDFDSDEGEVEESLVREYVEKVGSDWPNGASEGDAVGSAGKKAPINAKSPVIGGKNDVGGSTKNIARGGSVESADGKPTPKPSNEYTKGQGNLKGAGKFENVPGANTKGYQSKEKKYETEKGKEGQTTKGSVPVAKKSFNPGGKPGFKG